MYTEKAGVHSESTPAGPPASSFVITRGGSADPVPSTPTGVEKLSWPSMVRTCPSETDEVVSCC